MVIAAIVHRRKGQRWSAPTLLVTAIVVSISVFLPGGAAPAAAVPMPLPFLSPQSPPLAECTYPTSPITGTQVISYTYDPLYRLTDAAYSGGECFRYQYDKVGNRTVMTSTAGVATYQYDAANRLTNAGGQAYTWDNNGSLTSNGVFTFTYNAVGRMSQAQGITATQVYTYNGDGLLVSRNATRYVWDLASSLPQMLSDGGTLYVPGVAQFDGAAWTYQLVDGLGSVRQLVDAQGYVAQRYDYGPFGETLASEGKKSNTLRYTGEQTDSDTGLVYLRARWYDPTVGRFTTRDPFPGLAALPQTLHPYVYVNNNPINHTDLTGEFIDTLLDALSLGMSLEAVLYDLRTGCGNLGEDLLSLGADLVGFLLPIIPALGTVRRVGSHLDDLGDVRRIDLFGFRGTGRTAEHFIDTEPLIYSGHIGVSFDGGKRIYGFTPHAPDIPNRQLIDSLKQHVAYPGRVADDTVVFHRAQDLAEQGYRTRVYVQSIPMPEAELRRIQRQVLDELDMGPLSNKRYSFPGSEGCYNCATWPSTHGIPIPEPSGNLVMYIGELIKLGTPWKR